MVDPTLWRLTRHNPIVLLQRVSPERLAACARDAEFLAVFDAVLAEFADASDTSDTWYQRTYGIDGTVAYFSAEFGLHNSVPIYSGGLGVLAGDHCKTASDLGVPLVAVGLLYRRGYFDQKLRLDGWQEDSDERYDPRSIPVERVHTASGDPVLASVQADGRTIHVGAWRIMVGRVPIFLLDTDLDVNQDQDRELLHNLYAGGAELRLRQEWILGVGGVRVLRALGINPGVWHANEGHATFMLVERLRELTAEDATFTDAMRHVRASSLFTTHTPVPAGHDVFTTDQVERCSGPIWDTIGTDRETFFQLGAHPDHDQPEFHMTAAGIRLSAHVNGVADRHGQVSREMWRCLWPSREASQVPIRHVTNGVHLATWMANSLMDLLDEHLGPDWGARLDAPETWDGVAAIDDRKLWELHVQAKHRLLHFVDEEARRHWRDHWEEASHLVGAGTLLSPDALTIGFARRFATYKRANLMFRDPDRLHKLLVDPWRPVQFIFAGKAHPADDGGKRVLQEVYSYTRDSTFEGRIAFLEEYSMHIAHRLVEGVDLWLNLPRVPLEACGTSGMKAALNGVPQLGTRDGWWSEGFTGENGWQIPEVPSGEDPDAWDAEHLYQILEDEVVPTFFERDRRGIPVGWVHRMKQALHIAAQRFTGRRMLQQYVEEFYIPALRADAFDDDPPTL
jgi:starch phosphorylase